MNDYINDMVELKTSMREIIDNISINLAKSHKLLDNAKIPDRIGIRVRLENHPLRHFGNNLKSIVNMNNDQIGVFGIREQHYVFQAFVKVHGIRKDTEWCTPDKVNIQQKIQDLFDYFCLIVEE